MASVELRGLTKRYGAIAVVDDVSLRIEHGQLVCLLGPSGCGKTTTLRLIAGFIEPSAGEIGSAASVVSSPARTVPPERRNMSMIFQSYALWPHMTVAENVAYGLEAAQDGPRDDRAASSPAILATTQLGALAERYPGELSGGQQQRVVAGARAGRRAGDAAARRAAVQPRRQPARGDALRDPPPARRVPLHHRLRHPRPVRGDDHRRPDRGDEPRQDRAGRHAGGDLRPAALGIRRALHRRRATSSRARRSTPTASRSAGVPLRCVGDELAPGAAAAVSVRQHEIRLCAERRTATENVVPATVVRQVFLGAAATTWSTLAERRRSCAW